MYFSVKHLCFAFAISTVFVACTSIKLSDGGRAEPGKSYAVIRLVMNVDMNVSQSDALRRQCPVQLRLEGLSGINAMKEVLVPYVRNEQATIIELAPGDYYLKQAHFCMNDWAEKYDFKITAFRVHKNYLNYPGDWHITTQTGRVDDVKVPDDRIQMGIKEMSQKVTFNPDIEKEIERLYPDSYSSFPALARTKLTVTD